MVAVGLQRLHRLRLLLRAVPQVAIDAGGARARSRSHSQDGRGAAAERVGEQVLQGFHLAPLALLDRLHDTRLEPTDVAPDLPPGDGVPAWRSVGGRTSNLISRRHLL